MEGIGVENEQRITTQVYRRKKASILRKHFADKVPVSDICDEFRIQPSLFYSWQRQMMENLEASLQDGRSRSNGGAARGRRTGLEELQKLVGGYVEVLPPELMVGPAVLIVNEEGSCATSHRTESGPAAPCFLGSVRALDRCKVPERPASSRSNAEPGASHLPSRPYLFCPSPLFSISLSSFQKVQMKWEVGGIGRKG